MDINGMIQERYESMERQHAQLQRDLSEFMTFPDPNWGVNLVRSAAQLAQTAQGYQDLTDAAGLSRGYKPTK